MPNHVIVSTANWPNATLEDAVANIAQLDFGQVDLALHAGAGELSPAHLAADGGAERVAAHVQRLVTQNQMKRASGIDLRLERLGDPAAESAVAAASRLARALDIALVCVGLEDRSLGAAAGGSAAGADAWRRLAVAARALGAELAVQTPPRVTDGAMALVALAGAVPGLGIALDTASLESAAAGVAAVERALPLVRNVYLSDAVGPTAGGGGGADVGELVARLHALGYSGKFSIRLRRGAAAWGKGNGSPGDHGVAGGAGVLRVRDAFVGAERGRGIVRGAAPAAPAAR